MAIDRDAALRTADKLLRQGKLDAAIDQYVRLIDESPHDWTAINSLGDLYARAGNPERALAQFVRVADYFQSEGFWAKAAAIYKKALKVRPDHEHTLSRLADVAARQGLLTDAKQYLRQLADLQRARGDEARATDTLIRLGGVDESDGEAKMTAGRVAQAAGQVTVAAELFRQAAAAFDRRQQSDQALGALVAAAELAPEDEAFRSTVIEALIAAGRIDLAESLLSGSRAGDSAAMLVAVGRGQLLAGRTADGQATLMRALTIAPDQAPAIAAVADDLAAGGRLDDAYACVEILSDAALFDGDFERAAATLEAFVLARAYLPALLKLVDVYVDAGFDDRLPVVQGQLVEAYLEAGHRDEARVVAEDLFFREPESDECLARLRRVLAAAGVASPDDEVGRLRRLIPLVGPLDRPHGRRAIEDRDVTAPPASPPAAAAPLVAAPAPAAPPAAPVAAPPAEADPPDACEEIDLSDLLTELSTGLDEEAAADLGRAALARGECAAAIEWLERAAELAPPGEAAWTVLYDLADALTLAGEPVRALAVLIELDAAAGDYRDVRARIDQITREGAGAPALDRERA